jgi:hypothetical protein
MENYVLLYSNYLTQNAKATLLNVDELSPEAIWRALTKEEMICLADSNGIYLPRRRGMLKATRQLENSNFKSATWICFRQSEHKSTDYGGNFPMGSEASPASSPCWLICD